MFRGPRARKDLAPRRATLAGSQTPAGNYGNRDDFAQVVSSLQAAVSSLELCCFSRIVCDCSFAVISLDELYYFLALRSPDGASPLRLHWLPGDEQEGGSPGKGTEAGRARRGSGALSPRPPPRTPTRRRRAARTAYPSAAPGSLSSRPRNGKRRPRTCPRL